MQKNKVKSMCICVNGDLTMLRQNGLHLPEEHRDLYRTFMWLCSVEMTR
jgi:hypothetical protein